MRIPYYQIRLALAMAIYVACFQQMGCKENHGAVEHYNHGIDKANRGDYNTAIQDYTKAIELNPKFAKAYNSRAVAYFYKKDYEKAWTDVKKCQELGIEVNREFLKVIRSHSGSSR